MIAHRPAGISASCSARAGYPSAHRLDLVEELHGRQIADPYRWLETADSTATRQWVAAQEGLFSSVSSTWESQSGF
ncbi:MAG: hypothetical protein H0X18_14150, partial [Geodermatophilaceae bacterium]|nr:hypothetical protein [Geodermatophilaceae bacterium]